MWRDLRWITDALQCARYKQPRGGVPITRLLDVSASEPEPATGPHKTDSTSSNMEYLPTPSPSPSVPSSSLLSFRSLSSHTFVHSKSDQTYLLAIVSKLSTINKCHPV